MNQETLNNRQFYKKIAGIAVPIAVQGLVSSSLSLIDNLMVGSLGEGQLAAVGAAIQIYMIFYMFLYGFCSGSATFVAQFYGSDDMKNIRKTIGFTAMVCLGLGLIFFVMTNLLSRQIMSLYAEDQAVIEMGASYIRIGSPCFLLLAISQPFCVGLRATQQPKIPLYISFVAFGLNTILNGVLIFGLMGAPAMGTDGTALATVIARSVELVLLFYVIFGRKNIISGQLIDYVSATRELLKRMAKNNIPTTINESLWGIGQSMYMAAIGHISVTAYAATQACNTINNLFVMAGFSLGDAALIMVGAKIGEGDIEAAKAMAKKFIRISAGVGVVLGIMLCASSELLLKFFDFSQTGHNYAFKILIIYACAIPLNMVVGCFITGILRGGGDTKFAMMVEVPCVWFIGVPIAFLTAMVLKWPVYLVILATIAVEVVEVGILFHRFRTGKWANKVISNL